MYGSTRVQNGGVGNPEKGLQNGMDRNGGGGKSVRTRENPNTKRKERIRRRSENSKKVGYRSKWKGWPKEKALLDKGDGLATAAGARRNEEVTSQYIYKLTRAA